MRKGLISLLFATTLLGTPGAINCEQKASHSINLIIPKMRVIYVNETDDIIGIGFLGAGTNFPEGDIKVFKNESKIPFNNNIKEQYDTYLIHPEIAKINWNQNVGWHYYSINPQSLKDFVVQLKESLSDGTFKPRKGETLKDRVLYITIKSED